MLSKSDLILILTELGEDQNIDTTSMVADIVTAKKVPLDILKFINDNRQLDVTQFYTHIRKSYNQKRSKLYINIMREITDVNEALTTLASQIFPTSTSRTISSIIARVLSIISLSEW